MTDEVSGTGGQDTADAPLDHTDELLLRDVAAMLDVADPIPVDLVERVQFALALDEVFDEVASMTRVLDDALAVRTDLANATRTETVTFSADRLTSMVTLTTLGPGRVRIDGWVPPAAYARSCCACRARTSSSPPTRAAASWPRSCVRVSCSWSSTRWRPREDGLVVTPLFKL